MYHFKSESRTPLRFDNVNRTLGLIRKIKDGSVDLKKAQKNQEKFKSNLNEAITGKWESKSEDQENTINNLKMFYKTREKVITLFDHYTTIVSK